CKDIDSKPLAGVEVALYRTSSRPGKAERLHMTTTSENGRFEFRELLPPPARDSADVWHYGLVIRKKGYESRIIPYLRPDQGSDPQLFFLNRAATLQGRVTDPNGQPVVGAQVWTQSLSSGPVEGISCTRTDANGHFAITDAPGREGTANS